MCARVCVWSCVVCSLWEADVVRDETCEGERGERPTLSLRFSSLSSLERRCAHTHTQVHHMGTMARPLLPPELADVPETALLVRERESDDD